MWAAIAALGSLIVGFFILKATNRSNSISGSSAWATTLMQHVVAEISSAQIERDLMVQIFSNSHSTVEAKRTLTDQVKKLRDESHRRLDLLGGLASSAKELVAARDVVEGSDDSFFENSELPPPASAERVCKTCTRAYDAYLEKLRAFADDVNSRKFGPRSV
jgi:hypothetical protein